VGRLYVDGPNIRSKMLGRFDAVAVLEFLPLPTLH
jgi:hypothetical protein